MTFSGHAAVVQGPSTWLAFDDVTIQTPVNVTTAERLTIKTNTSMVLHQNVTAVGAVELQVNAECGVLASGMLTVATAATVEAQELVVYGGDITLSGMFAVRTGGLLRVIEQCSTSSSMDLGTDGSGTATM